MALKVVDFPFWMRCVLVVTLGLFVVNLFFFFAPVAAISSNLTPKDLFTGALSLVGTFVGAWFAFTLAKRDREEDRVGREAAAGSHALFTLSEMYNQVHGVKERAVDLVRDKPDAWLRMPVYPPLKEHLSFHSEALSFLMQKDPETYQQLLLEESRYGVISDIIKLHSNLFQTRLWPKLEAARLPLYSDKSPEHYATVAGPDLVNTMKDCAKAITEHVDDDLKSIPATIKSLRAALERVFPDRQFIDFAFPSPLGSSR